MANVKHFHIHFSPSQTRTSLRSATLRANRLEHQDAIRRQDPAPGAGRETGPDASADPHGVGASPDDVQR